LRTLQFLRASSVLQDYHLLENAIGGKLPTGSAAELPLVVPSSSAWLYRWALHRGYFDIWLSDYVARPVLRLFQTCDGLERRWTDFLAGGSSRESDRLGPSAGSLEDLA
jgi:NAD(P)H-quinone oxidoreductase subunit 5